MRISQITWRILSAIGGRALGALHRLRHAFIHLGRLYFYVGRELWKVGYQLRAAALAFASLTALVPLVAVVFSMYNAMGGLSQAEVRSWTRGVIEQYLLGNGLRPNQPPRVVFISVEVQSLPAWVDEAGRPTAFLWRPRPQLDQSAIAAAESLAEWSDRMAETVVQLAQRAGSAGPTAAGVALLFLSSLLLFSTVEEALNAIWHVAKRRRVTRKIEAYCTMLVIAPLLIGASIYSGPRLAATQQMAGNAPILGSALALALRYLPPLLITWGVFLLAYRIVPFTRVRWRAALAGALIAGLLWEIAKVAFGFYVAGLLSYGHIYGSLVALPIFLLWLYWTWLVVLFGAGVAYTWQNLPEMMLERRAAKREEPVDAFLALALTCLVARRFAAGEGAVTVSNLALATEASPAAIETALRPLVAQGLLNAVSGDPPRYLPARPLKLLKLSEIIEAIRLPGVYSLPQREINELMRDLLARIRAAEIAGIGDISLDDMVGSRLRG